MTEAAKPQASAKTTVDPQDMPYEQARDELIQVVQKLETGGTSLEESLTLWERGEALAAICQRWLDGARARLAEASAAPTSTEQSAAE